MSINQDPLDLSQIEFCPSIDLITIETQGKVPLPSLEGRPEWAVSEHYRRLTIHDLRPADVAPLARIFPDARILRAEIAVDMFLVASVKSPEERLKLLEKAFVWVYTHLSPYEGPFMRDDFTAAYNPQSRKVAPFNYRRPGFNEQLLYGHKSHPVQVKVYWKRRDNGQALDLMDQCIRMEVNMQGSVCHARELRTLSDLGSFQFRRTLAPYFRMMRFPVATAKRSKRVLLKVVHGRLARVSQVAAEKEWSKYGVQGARMVKGVKMKRHVVANQRIGKALQRLQNQFARRDLAPGSFIGVPIKSTLTATYATTNAQRITTSMVM